MLLFIRFIIHKSSTHSGKFRHAMTFFSFGISCDHPSSVRPQGWKGRSLVHLGSGSYSVGCQGEMFASLERLSPVSKEVCDFSGVSRLPGSKPTSQNQVSWLQRICVYLCFSGHSYMACVHSIRTEGWWWHLFIIISSSCQCPWCWMGTHKMLKEWL